MYSFLSFGYASFGRIWGTQQVCAGVTNIFQYVLVQMVYDGFDGNFLSLNVLQLIFVLLLMYFPLFLFFQKRQRALTSEKNTTAQAISG